MQHVLPSINKPEPRVSRTQRSEPGPLCNGAFDILSASLRKVKRGCSNKYTEKSRSLAGGKWGPDWFAKRPVLSTASSEVGADRRGNSISRRAGSEGGWTRAGVLASFSLAKKKKKPPAELWPQTRVDVWSATTQTTELIIHLGSLPDLRNSVCAKYCSTDGRKKKTKQNTNYKKTASEHTHFDWTHQLHTGFLILPIEPILTDPFSFYYYFHYYYYFFKSMQLRWSTSHDIMWESWLGEDLISFLFRHCGINAAASLSLLSASALQCR